MQKHANNNYYKYKKQLNKKVGMAGSKSTQTR